VQNDQSVYDALTDLSAYALTLDAEHRRLDDRLVKLAEIDSSVAERRAVLRERDDVAEQVRALRGVITGLQDQLPQRALVHHRPFGPK
jgi:hypothetical protein